MTENILNKMKEATSSIKEKVIDLKEDFWGDEEKEIISEFKDGGTQKVKEILSNANNSAAIFLKSGYELKNVSIKLGIPPSITATFQFNNSITEEEKAQILSETKDNKIIYIIVTCLFKAGDFYEAVKMGDYKLNNVVITLGLTPGITVGFAK